MLIISDVTFKYRRGDCPVLDRYSLQLAPGTICGLLGHNGAGKSTLLGLIAGLLRPQSGSIDFNSFRPSDRCVPFLNDIYFVPEEVSLPKVSLKEFVKVTAPFYPKFSLDSFYGHLETFELSPEVHLARLSMGQKKRVAIGFALACNTSLLLLDEPTNGLDIPGKRLFRKALLSAMDDDKTVIISTHQVYDVERIVDRVIITNRTGVQLDAPVNEITDRLAFMFVPGSRVPENALLSLDAPGGNNIVVENNGDTETEINLESLFELTNQNPELVKSIFKTPRP